MLASIKWSIIECIAEAVRHNYKLTPDQLRHGNTNRAVKARRVICYMADTPLLDETVVEKLGLAGLDHFRKNVSRLKDELDVYTDLKVEIASLKLVIRAKIKSYEVEAYK